MAHVCLRLGGCRRALLRGRTAPVSGCPADCRSPRSPAMQNFTPGGFQDCLLEALLARLRPEGGRLPRPCAACPWCKQQQAAPAGPAHAGPRRKSAHRCDGRQRPGGPQGRGGPDASQGPARRRLLGRTSLISLRFFPTSLKQHRVAEGPIAGHLFTSYLGAPAVPTGEE